MEKTEKMSRKTVRDRAAELGAANTYAEVLLDAAGVLVASSRQDHLVKLKDGDDYVQIYLADTPSDYRGVMVVGGWRVETGVRKSMDEALIKLRDRWSELYKEGMDSLRKAAVLNALEERNEAAKARYQKDLQDANKDIGCTAKKRRDVDVSMVDLVSTFDIMSNIHGILSKMMEQQYDRNQIHTIVSSLIEFIVKVFYREGEWHCEFKYGDHEDALAARDYNELLKGVWWKICDVMGWMYE